MKKDNLHSFDSIWNKNRLFAWQGRDSANDVQGVPDNVTDIGRFIKIEEPTDFIDFYDDV